jgi:arylsulfatase A-like enzyme
VCDRVGSLALALVAALTLTSCTTSSATDSATPRRPNILFIMSDDHSTSAVGCYDSWLSEHARTPAIDALAAEGMRFDAALCTNSICVPSRASILTGLYSHVTGITSLNHSLDPDTRNVAQLMQAGGYHTALMGKWHLKQDPSGFDDWTILPGQGRYHDPMLRSQGESETRQYDGFSTDIITDLSLDWLRQRDSSRPFLLMTHFKNCHEPWNYADRHAELYTDQPLPEPPSLFEDKQHRSPGSRDYGLTIETMAGRMEGPNHSTVLLDTTGLDADDRKRAAAQLLAADYLRCVASIDENVERLVDELRRQGILDETLVIYTSDQGYFLGEHNYIDKRWMYEESLRMPLVMRYPPEIAPGSVSDELVLNVDFAELFLDYAGLPVPDDMQGVSFRPLLRGEVPDDWRESMYYHYWQHGTRPAHYGVRTGRYKLIFFHGVPIAGRADKGAAATLSGWELYDLELDPHELRNVYDDPGYAEVVAELTLELDRLKQQLGDRDADHPAIAAARAGTTEDT